MLKPSTTLIAVAIAVLAAPAAAPQDANEAASAVKDVMVTMTVPASDAIFSAESEPPKDDAQWVALRASAKALADSGRVLITTSRAKDDREWVEMARALVTEAEATLKAIDARDGDALSQAAGGVYVTCETCHARYMDQ
jgi:cytochrome c556